MKKNDRPTRLTAAPLRAWIALLLLLVVTGCSPASKDPSVGFIVPHEEGIKASRTDDSQSGQSQTATATSTYRLHEVRAGGSVARKVSSSASFKVKGGLILVQ